MSESLGGEQIEATKTVHDIEMNVCFQFAIACLIFVAFCSFLQGFKFCILFVNIGSS
jgi:hypothetical protein